MVMLFGMQECERKAANCTLTTSVFEERCTKYMDYYCVQETQHTVPGLQVSVWTVAQYT